MVTDCEKRSSLVKTEGLCFNCLEGHKSSACQSKYRCRNCKDKHYTSVCAGHPGKSPSSPRDQPISPVHTTLAPNNSPVPINSVIGDIQIALLKTAVATVGTNHTYCEANILYDEGARRSFVTQRLAIQLGIDPARKRKSQSKF